jgi:hypothetical protein
MVCGGEILLCGRLFGVVWASRRLNDLLVEIWKFFDQAIHTVLGFVRMTVGFSSWRNVLAGNVIGAVIELFSPANAAETAGFAYIHECRRVH